MTRGGIGKDDQLRMFASTSTRDEVIARWIEPRSADGSEAQTLLLSSDTTCRLKSLTISPSEYPWQPVRALENQRYRRTLLTIKQRVTFFIFSKRPFPDKLLDVLGGSFEAKGFFVDSWDKRGRAKSLMDAR